MALSQALVQLLRRVEPVTGMCFMRRALALLSRGANEVETVTLQHQKSLKDCWTIESALEQRLTEQRLALNPASCAGFAYPSSASRIELPLTTFLRTLKTSAKVSSKPRSAKASLSPKKEALPHGNKAIPQAAATGSIAARLAENLAKVRSPQPVPLPRGQEGSIVRSERKVTSSSGKSEVSSIQKAALGEGAAGVEDSPPRFSGSDEERKGSVVVRLLVVMMLGYIGMNIYPLMGDSLVSHAVALTRSKDPFFQRSGASRVAMVATTDKRRQKIVELGGVTSLAKLARNDEVDDTTLNQVLDALVKVCKSQEAITALREAELGPRLQQILASRSDSELLSNASVLLEHASPEMVSDG